MAKNKGGDQKAGGKGPKGKGGDAPAAGAKQNGQKIKIRHILWSA